MNGLNNGAIASRPCGQLAPVDNNPTKTLLGRIAAEQSATHDLLERLEQRLQDITTTLPSAGNTGDARPSAATALLDALQERFDYAEGINNRLRSLLDSIVL